MDKRNIMEVAESARDVVQLRIESQYVTFLGGRNTHELQPISPRIVLDKWENCPVFHPFRY